MLEKILSGFAPDEPAAPTINQLMARDLANEKRRLEKLLTEYGVSRNQAKRIVHEFFEHGPERSHG